MPDNEIERLTVVLESDYSKLISQTKEGVDKAEKELDKLSEAPKKAQGAWSSLGNFLKGQFLGIVTTLGAAMAATFSVQTLEKFLQTLGGIAGQMIGANKQFEVFRTQFTTLLGSAGEAKKRIDELAKFGVATPFELDQIVEADRLLQTFGGTILATDENLRRVGDSAAAVNADFKEVSFWTGRLYSAIQAGKPFGEASMRLSELGILAPEVRTKMEALQKAGASGTEIWKVYADMVDTRFNGAMDKLSKTLQGVMSNLSDFQSMLLREGGEKLFEGVRRDAVEFYEIISDSDNQEALTNLAKSFGNIADTFREAVTTPLLDQIKGIKPDDINQLADSLDRIARAFGALTGQSSKGEALSTTVDTLTDLANLVATITNLLSALEQKTGAVSGVFRELLKQILPLADGVYQLYQDYKLLNSVVQAVTGKDLSGWSAQLAGVSEKVAGLTKNVEGLNEEYAHIGTPEEFGPKAPAAPVVEPVDTTKATEEFQKYSDELIDLQKELNQKREELEQDHGEKQAEIVQNYNEDILKLEKEIAKDREQIAEHTAEALEQLAADTAQAQADAQAQAESDLAKVESDTQDEIGKIREDAQTKERRATEDHQREMRRLHDQYLLNLEDAVKSRDARAIVDLRRKYMQERREKEEDFQTQRSRDREDTEKQVEQAKEAEKKRREEIKKGLEKQLADIKKNEEEKRREILDNQEKQLADLQEKEAEKKEELQNSLSEQLANEQKHYAESKAALDAAMQARLAKIAQALADEEGITKESAENVLSTLNDLYGEGGSIDSLMDGYLERQKARAEAMAALNAEMSATPEGGDTGATGESAVGGEGHHTPTFQAGGIVPGRPGQARRAVVHAGELIVPYEQVSKYMGMMRDSMAMNFQGRNEVNVNLKVSGSAPPGIGKEQMDSLAGVLVQAFNEAGIRTKKR